MLHWRRANIRRAALMVAGMAGIVALAVPATVLAWRSWRLLLLDDLEITESAAAIQGAAASMGLLATLCLVAVTAWYAFLVRRQMRQAGPDVGVDWFVLWSEPGARPGDMALKSPIESLSKGPIAEGHTEWKIAVEVRNSGNIGTSIQDAFVGVDDDVGFPYTDSWLKRRFPLDLQPHDTQMLHIEDEAICGLLRICDHLIKKRRRFVSVTVTLGSGAKLATAKVPLRYFRAVGQPNGASPG